MLEVHTTAQENGSEPPSAIPEQSVITLGSFAEQAIHRQFYRIQLHQQGVLQDQDPEHLHQMRVAFRRLRTALEIFQGVIQLPKSAGIAKIRIISKSLGQLRDLDVQLESVQTDLAQQSSKTEQKAICKVDKHLRKQRRKVFKSVKKLLHSKLYRRFCQSCEDWLADPVFTPLAQRPLRALIPELILSKITQLFIHPGWQLSIDDINAETSPVMHDLRKCCKHVRYQSEFFADFYGKEFKQWIKTLKKIQDQLGYLQDSYVFLAMIHTIAPTPNEQNVLDRLTGQHRSEALMDWEGYRQSYLSQEFRLQLYRTIFDWDDTA